MILILNKRQLRKTMATAKIETLQLHDFEVDPGVLAEAKLVIYVESRMKAVVLKAVRYQTDHKIVTLSKALELVPVHIT